MIRLATLFAVALTAHAQWTEPVVVSMDAEKCVAYDAKIEGGYLTVRATHFGEWHTYAMDNEERSKKALAGKMSLGVDGPTKIAVSGGAKLAGEWRQSEPVDLSKPEIRWYTFGYVEPALFSAKIQPAGSGPALVNIRAQACTASQCKNIDIDLTVPVKSGGAAPDVAKLVPLLSE